VLVDDLNCLCQSSLHRQVTLFGSENEIGFDARTHAMESAGRPMLAADIAERPACSIERALLELQEAI